MGWLVKHCARLSSLWPASRRTAIEKGLLLFTVLSLADLTLTWFLLERARGCASECNPVASWCLAHFGLPGLAGFKGGSVLILAALARLVARHRPRVARRLLVFGCSILLAVVLYSGTLVYRVETDSPALRRAQEMHRELDRKALRFRAYLALSDRLREDLVAHRCTLAEAVERLAASEHVQDPEWLRLTRLWLRPGWTLRECLADRLATHVLCSWEAGAPGLEKLKQELNAQYQSCFSRPLLPDQASAGSFRSDSANDLPPFRAGLAQDIEEQLGHGAMLERMCKTAPVPLPMLLCGDSIAPAHDCFELGDD
jgi:hypothetical protein